jgi:hypothetical protein
LLLADSNSERSEGGILVLDENGDRESANRNYNAAHQNLDSAGKLDNSVKSLSSIWANASHYFPLHVLADTPAQNHPRDRRANFRTKPQLALQLVRLAQEAGIPFKAVVADSFYWGGLDLQEDLEQAGLPYVLAFTASRVAPDSGWFPEEAAKNLLWESPENSGVWTSVEGQLWDGQLERWWSAELPPPEYGPDHEARLVVATTDPATLPQDSTWYLITNLPKPGSPRSRASTLEPADLSEVVRLYGMRAWVARSYHQLMQKIGWDDFMVRSERAILRHWLLAFCAFSFCRHVWSGNESGEKWCDNEASNNTADQELTLSMLSTVALVAGLASGVPASGSPELEAIEMPTSLPRPLPVSPARSNRIASLRGFSYLVNRVREGIEFPPDMGTEQALNISMRSMHQVTAATMALSRLFNLPFRERSFVENAILFGIDKAHETDFNPRVRVWMPILDHAIGAGFANVIAQMIGPVCGDLWIRAYGAFGEEIKVIDEVYIDWEAVAGSPLIFGPGVIAYIMRTGTRIYLDVTDSDRTDVERAWPLVNQLRKKSSPRNPTRTKDASIRSGTSDPPLRILVSLLDEITGSWLGALFTEVAGPIYGKSWDTAPAEGNAEVVWAMGRTSSRRGMVPRAYFRRGPVVLDLIMKNGPRIYLDVTFATRENIKKAWPIVRQLRHTMQLQNPTLRTGAPASRNEKTAVEAALLYREGISYVNIGNKFGWRHYIDDYGSEVCPESIDYVRLGEEILQKEAYLNSALANIGEGPDASK